MNSRQMECFVAVAESHNLRAASDRVFASISTISRQIAALEEEVGVPLFQHAAADWQLTPAGMIIYQSVQQILLLQTRDFARAREASNCGQERLRVAFFRFASPDSFFLDALNAFQRAHPRLELELFCYDVSMQEKFLRENRCDAAFGFEWEMPDSGSYQSIPVAPQRTSLYLGRNHPALQEAGFTPDMLENPTVWCIEGFNQMIYERKVNEVMHYFGIPRWHLQTACNWDTAWLNVAVGRGVMVSDAIVASPRTQDYAVFPVPDSLLPGSVRLCWRKDTDNPMVELFAQTLVEHTRQYIAKFATKSAQ